MYGYLDLTCFLLCLYSFIYGILVTQDEGFMGYDNSAFWIVIGVVGLFVYPVILESILHLYAHSLSTPEAPYEEYHAKLPIVYSNKYNITACGIEKMHPFDAQKYGKVAACAAMEKGWGINLSGGYHHCSSTSGGGFCVYADISLTIYWDAHQGNGHERDAVENTEVFIIDFYNPYIYPGDRYAKQAINYPVHIVPETTDSEYLQKLEEALTTCIPDFRPDLIIYNAGTDCMIGDPLGNLNISPQGIISRDECIFNHAMNNRIPVVMMLSGGYQYSNSPVIADSIENLFRKFNL